jgi:hypothetical protein
MLLNLEKTCSYIQKDRIKDHVNAKKSPVDRDEEPFLPLYLRESSSLGLGGT